MSSAADVRFWHTMTFRDAEAMIAWLGAIGFVEHATYRDETDRGVVVHAEWLWPAGGGVMFGTERSGGVVSNAGGSAAYLVTDEPDAVFERAVAAGATVVHDRHQRRRRPRPMRDEDYGGRGGTVADPEGNTWSFGSYQPA